MPGSLRWLLSEPRAAVLNDQCDSFVDRVDAMRDLEVSRAGEFVTFHQHGLARPLDEIRPHFPDEDERRIVEVVHLEKLPGEREFQQRADAARGYDEGVRRDHEM